jgi:hypothetical protein
MGGPKNCHSPFAFCFALAMCFIYGAGAIASRRCPKVLGYRSCPNRVKRAVPAALTAKETVDAGFDLGSVIEKITAALQRANRKSRPLTGRWCNW